MSSVITQPSKEDTIQIRAITSDDCLRVLDFMNLHFCRDEPLSTCRKPHEELGFPEKALLSFIEHGTCLMAVAKATDELAGLAICAPQEVEHTPCMEPPKSDDTAGVKIDKFLASVENGVDLFKRYNVEKILHLIAMCVKDELRGKQVGARLCSAVQTMGKDMGFELLTSDCTSFYSARIQEGLGWQCVNTVYYKDYRDENGQQVFNPPAPHECCRTYAVRL